MKKFTLLLFAMFASFWLSYAQTVNEPTSWPNGAWTLNGTFDAGALIGDPTVDANFSYDDDAAGSGSTDILSAESPVIDLTAADANGEDELTLDFDYNYNFGSIFNLEYYDADAASWVLWQTIADNSGTTSNWCGAIAGTTTSTGLDFSGFTATQLSGFRYRFYYDASSVFGWGFCVSTATLNSATSTPPPAGTDCTNPIDASTLPYTAIGDTTAGFGDDYSGSPGASGCGSTSPYLDGDDIVYSHTASADGTIDIVLSNITDNYTGVFVYNDCADIGAACVAGDTNGFSTADLEIINFPVTNGSTYYIVVSTWATPQDTTYDISITAGATCLDVSGLTLDSVTESSATISWTAAGGETAWEIAVQPDGTGTPGTTDGSGTDTTSNPHTESGLMSNTAYEVYVRAECTAGSDFGGWVGPLDFTTDCAAFTPDYTEDFASYVPSCWEEAADGDLATGPASFGSSNWGSEEFAHTSTSGLGAVNINMYLSGDVEWLLAPSFDLSAGGYELVVDVAMTDYNATTQDDGFDPSDEVRLVYSLDGTSWTTLATWNQANTPSASGQTDSYDLSAITASNVQFAFYAVEDPADSGRDIDFHIDNFIVRTPPACPDVSSVMVSNIGSTTADVSWTNGGSETDWEVAIQAQGTGTPGGSGTMTTSNPYNATGLTSNTAYEVYVRSDCGGGDLGGWIGPINFTTLPSCGDTIYDTGGAGGDYSSGESYTITYLPDAPGNVVTLDFTLVDLEGCCDTLSIYDGLTTGDPAFNADLEAPDTFTATNPSGAITLEFTSDGSIQEAGWEASYTCAAPPTCLDVSAIMVSGITTTTAEIAWTNGDPGDTNWEVAVQAQGTGMPGAADGSGTDTSSNPYSATGLTAQTDYEVWVRTDCGGGDLANWVGPVDFTTACPTFSLPLSEGFESGVPPACWDSFRGTNGEGTGFDWTSSGAFPNSGSSSAFVRYENVATGAEDWLVTPALDMTTATNPELSFYASQDFGVDYGTTYTVRVSTTDTDHASFATVETYTEADFSVDLYDQYVVDLSAYAGQATVYVAFVMDQDDGDNWYLDDVVVWDNVPTTFTYTSGTWTPLNPMGLASSDDDIVIAAGDYVLDADMTCDRMDVLPGASISIDAGSTLTVNDILQLQSSSTSYSSLILDGFVSGPILYDRHVNINGSGTTGSNDLISAPLTGQSFSDLAAGNPNILNNGTLYLFGPFEKNTGTYVTWAGTETATLDAGVGYRTATSDNSVVTFTGTAENGVVTNDIINGGTNNEEWNLIGNPYPSYLNVQDFLNHDVGGGTTNIQLFDAPTAAIWGYDGSALNGWTIYNLATTTPSTVITPGQGFFVSADAGSTAAFDVEFTPDMRTTGSSDDFIVGRTTELTFLTLALESNTKGYSTDFYFNANASEGFDRGYDAAIWGDTTPEFAIYSRLVQEDTGNAIALQALKDTDLIGTTVPLGVNANQGEQITFSIKESTLPENIKVYLDDAVKNTSTLLNNSDYKITPSSDLSGIGRFFLRYEQDELLTNGELDQLSIFSINDSDELVVSGQLEADAVLNLFDIQGRQVITIKLDNALQQNRIDVSNVTTGIYLATVQNNGQEITKKVIIE